jgi:hypothetical protein
MNDELRILHNFIKSMTKTYRIRTPNWMVVRDILLTGTNHSGRTSCYEKCDELGIDADSFKI